MIAGYRQDAAAARPGFSGWKGLTLAGVAAGVLVLAVANAHLVYVALVSQPDCVPHAKETGEPGAYRAARSSC